MRWLIPALAALCAAQDNEIPTFKTGVSVVKVDARVSDGVSDIGGLNAADFVVYDEGQPQKIIDFARESQPVNVLLVLDVSPSMRRTLAEMAVKTIDALAQLRPGDSVGVLLFADRSSVVQPFTTDVRSVPAAITNAIFKDTLGRTTMLNEALSAAAEYVRKSAPPGRRSILVVTDNQAMRGAVDDNSVVRQLHASDAVVNAIVLGETNGLGTRSRYSDPSAGPPDVFRYATATGGGVSSGSNPSQALHRLLAQSVTRYSLHYKAPPGTPGAFRTIRVDLAPGAKRKYPGAVVQARSGYNVAE